MEWELGCLKVSGLEAGDMVLVMDPGHGGMGGGDTGTGTSRGANGGEEKIYHPMVIQGLALVIEMTTEIDRAVDGMMAEGNEEVEGETGGEMLVDYNSSARWRAISNP